MRKKIGCWKVCYTDVDIYVTGDRGGVFTAYKSKARSKIEMGIGSEDWASVALTVVHELFEFSSITQNLVYEPAAGYHWNAVNRMFIMSHEEFCDVCGGFAPVVLEVLQTVHEEWEQFHKSKKERKSDDEDGQS